MFPVRSWDIFCTIIDNYGDIGVCWRLARQLVAEQGQQVRLWVDDLASFRRLCPEIDPAMPRRLCRGVEVWHWPRPFPDTDPADVVVEAFACELPANYLAAMAARQPKPVWINLEYLSAEPWIDTCHGMPSPHPSLPLTKYFFFPGFTQKSGGLLLEHDLLERRAAFQRDSAAQAAFWNALGLPPAAGDELRVSMFCYGGQQIGGLFDAWAANATPVTCLAAAGPLLDTVAGHFRLPTMQPGEVACRGSLSVKVLPFLQQDCYDWLLWACDCNFVRGEDSFVRAQWAGKPMVWQAYPQEEAAHLLKLDAFLDLYCAGLPADAAADLRACWRAWNSSALEARQWLVFWRHRQALQVHAQAWVGGLAKLGSLCSNLTQFVRN